MEESADDIMAAIVYEAEVRSKFSALYAIVLTTRGTGLIWRSKQPYQATQQQPLVYIRYFNT